MHALPFRQDRPNPYLCLTPDTGSLFEQFAAGLRKRYGKLPLSGIPRITRPRRKQGTAGGFTVVDPGGNWLRIASNGGQE